MPSVEKLPAPEGQRESLDEFDREFGAVGGGSGGEERSACISTRPRATSVNAGGPVARIPACKVAPVVGPPLGYEPFAR